MEFDVLVVVVVFVVFVVLILGIAVTVTMEPELPLNTCDFSAGAAAVNTFFTDVVVGGLTGLTMGRAILVCVCRTAGSTNCSFFWL